MPLNTLSFLRSFVLSTGIMMIMTAGPVYATAFDDPGARAVGSTTTTSNGLEPTKPEVDGGEIAVGGNAQVVVLFRNTTAQPIQVGAVNLYPSSTVTASVAMNDCSKEPLSPGAECPIALTVSAFQTGPWRIEMLVRHSGRSKVVTATIRGTVAAGKDGEETAKSDIQPIPDKVDFGTLSMGKPLVRSIMLRNITSTSITVKDVALQSSSNAEYSLNTNCDKLGTGQSCLVALTWSPQQKGPSEGFVVVQHDGPTGVTSIPVTAKFEPEAGEKANIFPDTIPGRGLLVATDEKIEFGDEVESEAAYTISLVNVGDADLELKNLSLSGADTGVSLLKKGCMKGVILAPVEACPLTVVWSPVRTGDMRDDIQISHDGARNVLIIPVTGVAKKVFSPDSKALVSRNGTYSRQIDRTQILQGYIISSFSPTNAIINGPSGSRAVTQGQTITLGGVQWTVNIVETGVEMIDAEDEDVRILLLFDRSLSTNNRTSNSQSSDDSASASSSSPSESSSSTSAPNP